jgi:hypothetical protein
VSDSSQTQLYYFPESTWGIDPATVSPQYAFRELRFTSERLKLDTETRSSNEIRADRQLSGIARVARSASGQVGIEASFGTHDDLIEGAMYSDWTAETRINLDSPLTGSVTLTSSGSTVQVPSASPSLLAGLAVGDYVEIGASTASPTNNGFYRVVSLDSDTQFTVAPTIPTDETANVTIRSSFIKNGTTLKSIAIEKLFNDVGEYQLFLGMRVGQWDLSITPGELITGNFSFRGKGLTPSGASVGNGSPVAVSTNDIANAVDNIGQVLIDDAIEPNVDFTEISFSVNDNLRDQPAIGNLDNIGIGTGRFIATGTIQAYFRTRALFERYTSFTDTSISFPITVGGNSYVIAFPSTKITDGEVVAEGNDDDVLTNLTFEAFRNPDTGYTMGVGRFGTIPAVVT